MSEKLNRAPWLGSFAEGCCAVCLAGGVRKLEAKGCDGIHRHSCGGKITAAKSGFTCENGHTAQIILNGLPKERRKR